MCLLKLISTTIDLISEHLLLILEEEVERL